MSARSGAWSVYLLNCADDSYYCGITKQLERRIDEHNNDPKKASRYVWSRRPGTLAWSVEVEDYRSALKLERRVKSLTRARKLALVEGNLDPSDLLHDDAC